MNTLHRHLRNRMERAILDFKMIQPGDRLLVAVSGGADSLSLLTLIGGEKVHVSNDISILAVYLDLGFGDGSGGRRLLEEHFRSLNHPYHIEVTDIGPVAHGPTNRKNPCFLCSRLRRRRLYEIAHQHGCNKIALGHHRDDIVETFLLNVMFSREISTMVPNQGVFRGMFRIIRPLSYIDERLLKTFARQSRLPVLPDRCPSSPSTKRKLIKSLLAELESEERSVKENIFKALSHVKTDYLFGGGGP